MRGLGAVSPDSSLLVGDTRTRQSLFDSIFYCCFTFACAFESEMAQLGGKRWLIGVCIACLVLLVASSALASSGTVLHL